MAGHPDVETDAARFVSVASIDLGALIADARAQVHPPLPPPHLNPSFSSQAPFPDPPHLAQVGEGGVIIVKMDVEGAEYPMLRNSSLLRQLCAGVDFLLMEWHRMAAPPGFPPNFESSVAWLLEAEGCRCAVWHDCENE